MCACSVFKQFAIGFHALNAKFAIRLHASGGDTLRKIHCLHCKAPVKGKKRKNYITKL